MDLDEALRRIGALPDDERTHRVWALMLEGEPVGVLVQAHDREWGHLLSELRAGGVPECRMGCGLTIAD